MHLDAVDLMVPWPGSYEVESPKHKIQAISHHVKHGYVHVN